MGYISAFVMEQPYGTLSIQNNLDKVKGRDLLAEFLKVRHIARVLLIEMPSCCVLSC